MADVPPNIFHSTQQRFRRAAHKRYNVKAGVTVLHPTPETQRDHDRRQAYIGQTVSMMANAAYDGAPPAEYRVVTAHYDFEDSVWKFTLVNTEDSSHTLTLRESSLRRRLDPTARRQDLLVQDITDEAMTDDYHNEPVQHINPALNRRLRAAELQAQMQANIDAMGNHG